MIQFHRDDRGWYVLVFIFPPKLWLVIGKWR